MMSNPPDDWGAGPLGQQNQWENGNPWWYASPGYLAFIAGVLTVLLFVVLVLHV